MEPFIYTAGYPFAICQICKIGFVTSEVTRHLKAKHGEISQQKIKSITQEVAANRSIANSQAELQCWVSPPPTIQPNPHLQPPQHNRLGCNECPYVVGEVRRMQAHCHIKHGWVNDWKKGGNVRQRAQEVRRPKPWRTGVQCQQICNWGHGKRLFEVGRAIDQRNDARGRGGGHVEVEDEESDAEHKAAVAFLDSIQEEDEKAFEDEASGRIQDVSDKWDVSAWLGRCGWPRHLEGITRDRLTTLLEPIRDDEPVLQRMWAVFDQVLDEAYDATARECYPGTAELFEIARKEAHVTTAKPFQGLMEPDAWDRYKSWWKQLFCIWKRYQVWDEEDARRKRNASPSPGPSDSISDSTSNISIYDGDESSRDQSPPLGGTTGRQEERPPYKMTIRQEELWKAFDDSITHVMQGGERRGRYSEEGLQRSCLDAVVQLFDHPLKNGNHYESIVISALAVMGLDEAGGWKPVQNYTPIYSAVVKVARYLVLHQSILERKAQIQQLAGWMSVRQAEEEAEGLFRIVRAKVRRFMIRIHEGEDAEPSPMNWIINTRTYGMHIRFTTPGSEMIDWRGDQIIHGRIKIKMDEISDMLHALVGEGRQTLVRLASGMVDAGGARGDDNDDEEDDHSGGHGDITWPPTQDILPAIPWAKIEDRHGEAGLQYSFLSNDANQDWVAKGHRWVQRQVKGCKKRTKSWLADSRARTCPYKEKAIRSYGRTIEQFRSQLFMMMHMLGGQPARSTEILGLRMWNTMNGGVRNIFIHEGMVCFVTMYHKGFRQSGNIKVIHRYLPREVGELLVWYMWLVLPFWQNIQGRMKQKKRRSAFLWADEVVSQEGAKDRKIWHVKPSRVANDGSSSSSNVRSREGEEEREEEAAFMQWFREAKWANDRVRRVMQRYSTQFSGQEINISAWRQMAIGISNRYLNKVFSTEGRFSDDDDDDEGGEAGGGLVDSIHDLQAGHGSHIAGLIYARLFGQGDLGTLRSRDEFRKISMQWHRFFGFGAEDRVGQLGVKRERCEFDDERDAMRRRRFGRLHRADIKGQLGQMMGPSAAFRGLQEPVIRAVARGEWPIVQIAPTGGGKSLTFMLPAYCTPDGVTVVVTPLVSLEDDMVERCVSLGIDAYVWNSRGVQRAASLVFVTPESAVGKGFRTFVERMHGQQRLDRVVVDECHMVMRYSKTFRPQMGRLGETLQDFGVPVVCLTATLKPAREMAFFEQMRFTPTRVRMFREFTTRPNIQYSVVVIEDGNRPIRPNTCRKRKDGGNRRMAIGVGGGIRPAADEEEGEKEDEEVVQRACDTVRAWTAQHEEGKVIIYGGTIVNVKGVAKRLGCMTYWRGVGDAADKARRVTEWRGSKGGEAGWVAATNALGLGVDDPNVRLVVHTGMPRHLDDFVQESGRGGRDGRKSESVVIVRRSWLQQEKQKQQKQRQRGKTDEWAWDPDTVEFAEGIRCRREVLDREMDGNIDRFGCTEGEEVCDVCKGQQMTRDMVALEGGLGDMVSGDDDGDEGRNEDGNKGEDEEEADYQISTRLTRRVETQRRSQVMQEAGEIGIFEDILAEWAGCCIVCVLEGQEEDIEHEMEICRYQGSERWTYCTEGYNAVREEMMERKRFANFAACFDCGLPQALCDGWVADSDDGRLFRRAVGKICQYGNGLVFRVMVAQRARARAVAEGWWVEQMEMMIGSREEGELDHEFAGRLYEWLGALIEWGGRPGGGIQASRLCQVIVRIEKAWVRRR